MDFTRPRDTTAAAFRDSIVPRVSDYIRIPNKTPLFDAEWQAHGHMDRAAELMAAWCRELPIAGLKVEILREKGRTPLLFCEIPGQGADTVLSTATWTSSRSSLAGPRDFRRGNP